MEWEHMTEQESSIPLRYSAGTLAATAMLQDPGVLPTLMSAYALQGISVRHTSQLPTWVSTFQQPARSLANITLASTSAKPAPTQAGFASYPCAGVDDAAFLSKRLGQPIYLAVSPTRHIEASVTLNRVLADGTLSAAIPRLRKPVLPWPPRLAHLLTLT